MMAFFKYSNTFSWPIFSVILFFKKVGTDLYSAVKKLSKRMIDGSN